MIEVMVDGTIVPIFDNRDDAVQAINEEKDPRMRKLIKGYNFALIYSTPGFRPAGSLSEDKKLVNKLISRMSRQIPDFQSEKEV